MSRTVLRASFRSRAIALIFRFCTKYARRTLAIVSTVTIPLLTPGANHALGVGLPPGGWGQIWTPITPKEGSKLHVAQQPGAPSFPLASAYAWRNVSILQMWTYRPQKRQDVSAFALTYSLRLRSCNSMDAFVISSLPSLRWRPQMAGPPHGELR